MTALTGHLENVIVGSTVTAQTQFIVPASVSISGAVCTYDILDDSGVVYASGSVNSISNIVLGTGENKITASITALTIPSLLTPTVSGSKYLLRWTLVASGNTYSSFESFSVLPSDYAPLGGTELVELAGDTFNLSLILPVSYTTVECAIYSGNTVVVATMAASLVTTTSDGYLYQVLFNSATSGLVASLVDYQVMWSYHNVTGPVLRDSNSLFLVTPSLIAAAKDVQSVIARAYVSTGNPDVTFSTTDLMTFLRLGADTFNSVYAPTLFTMTNALGSIRAFWLAYSQVAALRAQYLAEGMKAFDFGGQAVTLSVDKTSYFESMASSIESAANDRCNQFKKVLSKRGITSGDGSASPLSLQFGAIGAIGIGLHPMSNIGLVNNQGGLQRWW